MNDEQNTGDGDARQGMRVYAVGDITVDSMPMRGVALSGDLGSIRGAALFLDKRVHVVADDVLAQRDELLAACKAADKALVDALNAAAPAAKYEGGNRFADCMPAVVQIRAAIANAERKP